LEDLLNIRLSSLLLAQYAHLYVPFFQVRNPFFGQRSNSKWKAAKQGDAKFVDDYASQMLVRHKTNPSFSLFHLPLELPVIFACRTLSTTLTSNAVTLCFFQQFLLQKFEATRSVKSNFDEVRTRPKNEVWRLMTLVILSRRGCHSDFTVVPEQTI